MPRVSVCIRAYSRATGLAAAIESALAQTYRDLEVVVSDDGGRLAEVALGTGDPRVRYSRNPAPAGPAANLARVASLAEGEFIAILNEDDRWLPEFLTTTVDVLDSNPDVAIAFTDDWLEAGGRRMRRRLPFRPGRHERFLGDLLAHAMPASANLIRRDAWEAGERAVALEPHLVGDALVWLRTAAAGRPFFYVDEPLGVSGVNASQVTWSEALPDRMIATFGAFRFEDPECERLRRARMSEFLLARAQVALRRRRFADAWTNVGRAHRIAPRPLGLRSLIAVSGIRGAVMRRGARHPALLIPLLELWRRVRPPLKT